MSIPNVPVPPYVDVPNVPGVPPLLRSLAFPTSNPLAVFGDGSDIFNQPTSSSQPQWGIFDSANNPVLTSDTVVGFDFKHEYVTVDYPIENGGFASYNKVARPFEPRFTMARGGSVADRTAFVTALERLVGDTNLYTVVTPEFTWQNVNITHWSEVRRSDRGVSLITVEIWLQEIRQAPAPAFSNTKTASAVSPTNVGTVQGQTPTPAQASNAAAATVPGPDNT